jgi:hypothetical protein
VSVSLFAGLITLYVTHVFSPYLNHPIGLGYLLFLLPFLPLPKEQQTQGVLARAVPLDLLKKSAVSPSPAFSKKSVSF